MAEGAVKMQISLEKYEAMLDRIAQLTEENKKLIEGKHAYCYMNAYGIGRKWISYHDRLPDDDRDVLAVSNGRVLIANYLDGWFYYIENEDGDMCPSDDLEVSYWMELPEPPEVEDAVD